MRTAFKREVGEVDHAALDGARRILAIGELVLAVVAAVVAHEGRVEILDRLGNRDRAEHQVLVVAALARVVDVELVDGTPAYAARSHDVDAVVASIFWWP